MAESKNTLTRADYGIDAPQVVLGLFVFGAMAISLGIAACAFLGPRPPWYLLGFCSGASMLLTAIVMVWGSRVGKVALRERVLDTLSLRGTELILDVGCGRGLFLIGAAMRLSTGKVIGIDIWHAQDQSGNSADITLQNARAEGAADRVEIKTADARQLPFERDTFDVVVSSWALHNLYDPGERTKALNEIGRVLKPGGRIAIIDIRYTFDYARFFRGIGFQNVGRCGPHLTFLIPSFTLHAEKPAGAMLSKDSPAMKTSALDDKIHENT